MQRNKVYKNKKWITLREQQLKDDHYECQRCKGIYKPKQDGTKRIKRATCVHHHFEVSEYPQFAYQKYVRVGNDIVRNLYSLCFECHEEIHGRGIYQNHSVKEKGFSNKERWD